VYASNVYILWNAVSRNLNCVIEVSFHVTFRIFSGCLESFMYWLSIRLAVIRLLFYIILYCIVLSDGPHKTGCYLRQYSIPNVHYVFRCDALYEQIDQYPLEGKSPGLLLSVTTVFL